MEILGLGAWMIFALLIGFGFLWIVAKMSAERIRNEPNEPYRMAERRISTAQLERRDERMRILEDIRALPKHPNGTYADYQEKLWDKYNNLLASDEKLSAKERDLLSRLDR